VACFKLQWTTGGAVHYVSHRFARSTARSPRLKFLPVRRFHGRSGLEWVIDQYRVTRDEHENITSDPNRPDDEKYIVRLIGQVITVSLKTQTIIKDLPKVSFAD
jgi:hypothetical protein